MASTKALRRAKRESSHKGYESDSGSVMKIRKAHHSKDLATKGAVKKATAKAKKTRETIIKSKSLKEKPIAQNGRQPGRQLIRWNASTDQILLLVTEYELKKHGIVIPYDAIAKRLASEKDTTGACIQQHLAKLRKELLARGSWVPPLAGKPSARQSSSDVRGLVMESTGGQHHVREIGWDEDAFKYVDTIQIHQAKICKDLKIGIGNESTGFAAGLTKMKKSSTGTPVGDDPADLRSEDEFGPTKIKSDNFKRITRSSAKSAGRFNENSDEVGSGTDNESDSDEIHKEAVTPVMMALYESEEEGQEWDGKLIFRLPYHIAIQFPPGVNVNTPAAFTGTTSGTGELVSGNDGAKPSPLVRATGALNSSTAMIDDQDDSIMDANTIENYLAAFPGMVDPDYSVMDANTHDNYMEAFGDDVAEYDAYAPAGDVFGTSIHGVPNADRIENLEHTWPLEVQQLYRSYAALTNSVRPPMAPGQNTVDPNTTGRRVFPSGTRVRDIFNGGPVNREAGGNSADDNVGFDQASVNNSFGRNTHYGSGQDIPGGNGYMMEATDMSMYSSFPSDETGYDYESSSDVVGNNTNPIDPGAVFEEDLIDSGEIDGMVDDVQDNEQPEFNSEEYSTFHDEYDFGPLFESEY